MNIDKLNLQVGCAEVLDDTKSEEEVAHKTEKDAQVKFDIWPKIFWGELVIIW